MLQITLKGETTKDLRNQINAWLLAEQGLSTESEAATEVESETVTEIEAEPPTRKNEATKNEGAYDLETDIIPAMKAFAKRHSREEAMKVLKRFDAKSTKDVNPKDYFKLMVAIS